MTSANRLRVTAVRETTPGVTPNTPRARIVRITGESLEFTPEYGDSDELRDDRQTVDPYKNMQGAGGGISAELSFPDDNSPASDQWRSTFQNAWNLLPARDNDGVADSVITGIATTNEEVTCVTGTAFVANTLVRFSGFGVAGNNGVFKCTTGGATTARFLGAGLTDEAAPPAAARMQTVGLEGASGDLVAAADGITSTALDFTTIPGLAVHKWVKIGGAGAGNRFATEGCNGWARIAAIADKKLTLDNLPSGWATDAGTGKTLKVWFGEHIRNGVAPTAVTLEKGFMGQQTPTYIVNRGMQVNTHALSIRSRDKVTQAIEYMGMGGGEGTVSMDATPDPATTGKIMAANANVGGINENGARLTAPNWVRELSINFANNLRTIEASDETSPVGIEAGDFGVSITLSSYFGDRTMLTKVYNGTQTSLSSRIQQTSGGAAQALIFSFPRVTPRGGNPQASGKNTDVMLPVQLSASVDPVMGYMAQLDRIPYFEA